ncbi:hypothetical protein STCU_03877 [Strigomonas culicis]|nr:hypothetical protein STCU_03877 [Strigomonas culicis]|eukprot:EPY30818.1 hypothetical protein STCU_03877 [Strigomonas culicis]
MEGDRRAREARSHMAEVHSHATAETTGYSVQASHNENERQRQAEADAAERRSKRTADVQESEVKQGALDMGFASLYQQNVANELHRAFEQQKKDCDEVIAAKNQLIRSVQANLEESEGSYVKLLKDNAEDVNKLVQTMHTMTDDYLDNYTGELEQVEKTYEKERKDYMAQCDGELEQLIKTRRTKETMYRKQREAKIVEAQKKLEERYEEGYEDYNEAKGSQKKEIHELIEELEKGKSDFMLNGERLNYNLQVLRERVKESKNANTLYKRRIGKLQDTMSNLIARHQESEKRHQRLNKDLTNQLRRVDTQYQDLQKKFQLFEKTDKEKYRQLWKLNNQKCKQKVHRVLQADRVLFEDILNLPWQPPELSFWPDEQENLEGMEDDAEDETLAAVELSEPALMLLQILRAQAPFLVDENVRLAIESVEGTTEEQAALEGILTTLKIEKNDDVRDLLEYFIVENEDESVALINPQEAIRALTVYLEDQKQKAESEKEQNATSTTKNKQHAQQVQRERRKAAEKAYWKKLAEPVAKDHFQVWSALEEGLEQYLAQLQQRKTQLAETEALRLQNEELRALLGQYINSDINYELYSPPELMNTVQRTT